MNEEERIKKVFADNLKRLMKEKNVNQTKISEIAGVSQQSVSNWLNEKQIPRMGVIEKLAEYFKVFKSDLLEDKNSDDDNQELILINRAMKRMTQDQKNTMMEVLKVMFKDEFGDDHK